MTRGARGQAVRPLRTTDRVPSWEAGAGGVPPLVVPPAHVLGPVAHHDTVSPGGGWHRSAACRDTDPETFYPLSYRQEEQVRPARRICGRCPVRAACLADVMATEDPAYRWGVCGGTTPAERTALRRAGLSIAPVPAVGGGAA